MDGSAPFEECFEHRAWVRALAERLCADESDARDLEQETWLAVARRGGDPRSPRRWLGGVVRHLARRERGRSLARGERERRAARPEALPSADALLARAELQRRVLAAVAELDEAQRIVVLMRYAEGLEGAEIARRLGCPGSTVRSRLARAHARLRARLDGEYGGERAAWSVLLAPALVSESGAGAASIGAGIAMKLQLALGAVLAAAVTVFLWPARSAERDVAPPLEGVALAAVDESIRASASPAERVEEPEVGTATEPPAPALVFGDLLGLDGAEPVGELVFVDARGAPHSASLSARGTYSAFGLAPGTYRIHGRLDGFVPLEAELELPPGEERRRRDLHLRRALVLPVRFVDRADGREISSSPVSWTSGLGAIVTRELPARGGTWRAEPVLTRTAHSGELGSWKEAWRGAPGLLEVWEPPPVYASAVLREFVLDTRRLHGDETELVFEIDRAELDALLASVSLRCVDGVTGAPLAGARVAVNVRDSGGLGAEVQPDGTATVEELAPGWRRLVVRAEGYGVLVRWLRLEPGARLDLGTLELLPAARVRGRVVDEAGVGLSVTLSAVALRSVDGPMDFLASTFVDSVADGSFELYGLEADRLRVFVRDDEWAWAAVDVDARSGAADGIELALRRGTEVWLRPPRGMRAHETVLVEDAPGAVLGQAVIGAVRGRRLRLAPGEYALRRLADDPVAPRQSFLVGSEPLVVEVERP